MPNPKGPYLSPRQLAEEMGIGDNLAYGLAEEGKVPCIRGGTRYIIPIDGLKKYNEFLGIIAAAKVAGLSIEELARLIAETEAGRSIKKAMEV